MNFRKGFLAVMLVELLGSRISLLPLMIKHDCQASSRIGAFTLQRSNDESNSILLRGEVIDAETGRLVASRVYIQGENDQWFFPKSEAATGSAVPYRKRSDRPNSVEMYTTLSSHPFAVSVPPGRYEITVERGKEYLPQSRQVTVDSKPVNLQFKLERWIKMEALGWYSGDTHVHRPLEELPNVMLAEDLNVTFPLLYWVTEAFTSPRTSQRSSSEVEPKLISVDAKHIIYPRNTEYEIFTVGQKSHTLGAFFALNHKTAFDMGVPPVRPIAQRAHQEGGLIELDKHNWPWSMMLVPILKADLYELANNHMWRTEFAYREFGEKEPDYLKLERDKQGWTERGWIDYGFSNYYALLDCGFRLRPTAGTASGVHPVPLGFGRVYVHLPGGFSYEAWVRGLNQGRSFVTTGPMLFVRVDDQEPGHVFKQSQAGPQDYHVRGSAMSCQPLQRIEIIVNGEVVRKVKPENKPTKPNAYESPIEETFRIDSSSWIAVRCFEDRPDKRVRFAHTGPVYIDVAGKPLRPQRAEVEFLIKRVEDQIKRNAEVLPSPAMEEYREALAIYQEIAKTAR